MTIYPLVGIGLPTMGPRAGPAAIREIALAAERHGFHSVSLSERILQPGDDSWRDGFGLPQWSFYDAIDALTWVARANQPGPAAHRSPRAANPAARRAGTPPCDARPLSNSRVEVSVARMPTEFQATGVEFDDEGAVMDKNVAAMRALGTRTGPVSASGAPGPVQCPQARQAPAPTR